MEGCKVVVVGGGPAGIVAAAQFAQLGATVTVYESRSLSKQHAAAQGWVIALGEVAREAIEAAGLSADFGGSSRAEGRTMMRAGKEPRHGGRWSLKEEQIVNHEFMITRTAIVQHLRKECSAKYSGQVTFMDGHSLLGGNLQAGEAVFQKLPEESENTADAPSDAGAGEVRVKADLIVAADGVNSQARTILQKLDPGLLVDIRLSSVKTLTFSIPPCGTPSTYATLDTPCGSPTRVVPEHVSADMEGSFVGFLAARKGPPTAPLLIILSVMAGGMEVSATLTCGWEFWDQQRNRAEMQKVLEEAFPDTPTLWLSACADACTSPDSMRHLRTANFIKCSKLGSGRCVLIGDSAHAHSANIGSGCTTALQDTTALAACVAQSLRPSSSSGAKSGVSVPADVADDWTRARLHDAHACVRISKCMEDMGRLKLHKSPLLFAQSLPVSMAAVISMMPLPGKALLAPPLFLNVLANGDLTPSQLEAAMTATFYRVLLLTGTVSVVAVAAAARAWR